VVLDVNGTLALDGRLLPGVAERLRALGPQLDVHLITADTFGAQDEIDRALGLKAVRLGAVASQTAAKADFVRSLGRERVVAIGNGANDAEMLSEASLGIAIVGPEGAAVRAVAAADVAVSDILVALDLLLHTKRLVATLRV
jgi:P-type E1-E2 ATPase